MSKFAAQVMPIVSVDSVDETREFYVEKLGFDHLMAVVGADGQLDFCTLLREGGRLMFTRAGEPSTGVRSSQFYVQVSDVEGYYHEVVGRGITPTDLEDMWWGDRVFIVVDNNGYRLWFYQSMGDPVPPTGMKIV